MQNSPQLSVTNITKTNSNLTDFYNSISRLNNIRFVQFTGKEDEADCIDWLFTYRKRKFILQYSIYNGLSLFSGEQNVEKLIKKLVAKLKWQLLY